MNLFFSLPLLSLFTFVSMEPMENKIENGKLKKSVSNIFNNNLTVKKYNPHFSIMALSQEKVSSYFSVLPEELQIILMTHASCIQISSKGRQYIKHLSCINKHFNTKIVPGILTIIDTNYNSVKILIDAAISQNRHPIEYDFSNIADQIIETTLKEIDEQYQTNLVASAVTTKKPLVQRRMNTLRLVLYPNDPNCHLLNSCQPELIEKIVPFCFLESINRALQIISELIRTKSDKVLRIMLQCYPELAYKPLSSLGLTFLHILTPRDHQDFNDDSFFDFAFPMMQFLLQNKADPNACNDIDRTPLHYALTSSYPSHFVRELAQRTNLLKFYETNDEGKIRSVIEYESIGEFYSRRKDLHSHTTPDHQVIVNILKEEEEKQQMASAQALMN